MKINELMASTSVPWKWTYRSERQATAEFTVGNVLYEFKAKNSEYDHVDADRDAVGYDDDEETEEVDYRGYWEISFTGERKSQHARNRQFRTSYISYYCYNKRFYKNIQQKNSSDRI